MRVWIAEHIGLVCLVVVSLVLAAVGLCAWLVLWVIGPAVVPNAGKPEEEASRE